MNQFESDNPQRMKRQSNKTLIAMEDGPELSKPMSDTAPAEKIDSSGKRGRLSTPLRENSWSSIELKAKEFPAAYRNEYLQAMSGKSRRLAIKTHCLECLGFKREEVKTCTRPVCPLYPYRTGGCK